MSDRPTDQQIEDAATVAGIAAIDKHAMADPCPEHPDADIIRDGVCCTDGDAHLMSVEDAVRHSMHAAMDATIETHVRLTVDAVFGPAAVVRCPECAQGKCGNCDGSALDEGMDDIVNCGCPHA